jgi:endonuclease/exonuclease/phosphatase family metal-dependent hydrolase
MGCLRILLLLSLSFSSSLWALRVTDSVALQMEALERGEGLAAEKYSWAQWQDVQRALAAQKGRVRVMSYNMLFNLNEDQLEPQHHWERRLSRIVELIRTLDPDVIGSQELQQDQLDDLLEEIHTTYAFFGRGTIDGHAKGEINGIFYRKNRFTPLVHRVWWMGQTPDSPGPDHFVPVARTLTMVQLLDKVTQERLAFFNTHFSFGSANSRDESARFIAQLTSQYAAEIPVIVMGDFNLFPNQPDLKGLPFLDGPWAYQLLTKTCLVEARDVSVLGHLGPLSTYTNQGLDPTPFVGTGNPGIILDHIFISRSICVLLHAIDPARVDGNFPSDHMPVVADIIVWNGAAR